MQVFFLNQTFLTCKKYNLEEMCVGDTPGIFFGYRLSGRVKRG